MKEKLRLGVFEMDVESIVGCGVVGGVTARGVGTSRLRMLSALLRSVLSMNVCWFARSY